MAIRIQYLSLSIVFVFVCNRGAEAGWYQSGWSNRKALTVDNTDVPETLADFPVLVRLSSDADLAADAQADGDDILFTSADGETQLDHEIESFDGGTGELVAWVKVPSIASSVDTVFYMYYGNSGAAAQENPSGTWSNGFVSVYHLHDDFEDSVGANDGTDTGSDNVTGQIADGRDFENDDTTDRIDIGTFSVSGEEITITGWMLAESIDDWRVISKANGTSANNHVWMIGTDSTRLRFRLKTGTNDSVGTSTVRSSAGVITTATWYYVVAKYDGSNMRGRLDATEVLSASKTGDIRVNSWSVTIGNNPTLDRNWDGSLDEIRISNVYRSDGWNDACYENQKSSSTFLSLGSEETLRVWNGSIDTDWFDADNWTGGIPTASDSATIPTGLSNYPVLTSSGAVCDGLLIDSGASLGVSTQTITVSGGVDVDGTITIGTGTLDVAGTFDAAGAAVTFTGAGILELGGSVPSLGTLTVVADCVVSYDSSTVDQTVLVATYQDLTISCTGRVATSGGDITVNGDLIVSAGEFEVDDGDTLDVRGDVTVTAIMDLEPESALLLGNGSSVAINSGGTFQSRGTSSGYALISSANDSIPWRYSFRVASGGSIDAEYAYFRYMDATGIRIDRASDIVRFDQSILDEGATAGTLLQVDAAASPKNLVNLQFVDSNGDLSYNVATISSSAVLTIDPYDSSGFGGPANEDDNGSGTVTPGFIQWGAQTWVQLERFEAVLAPGAGTLLRWATTSEISTVGYQIEFRARDQNRFVPVQSSRVKAVGLSPDGASYRWVDPNRRRLGDEYRLIELTQSGGRRDVGRAVVQSRSPTGLPPTILDSDPPIRIRPASPTNRVGRVLLEVAERGVYRVDVAELEAVGLRVPHLDRLRLRRGEVELPIDIERRSDVSGGRIYFFAEGSRFSDQPAMAYEVDVAPPGPRLRVPLESATTGGATTEFGGLRTVEWGPDVFYGISALVEDKRDLWFASVVTGVSEWTRLFHLPGIDSGSSAVSWFVRPVRVRLDFDLATWDPLWRSDELMELYWNDTLMGSIEVDRLGRHLWEVEIPTAWASPSPSELRLKRVDAVGGEFVVWVNSIALEYSGEFQAADDRFERRREGARGTSVGGFTDERVRAYRWNSEELVRVETRADLEATSTLTDPTFRVAVPDSPSDLGSREPVELHVVGESSSPRPRRLVGLKAEIPNEFAIERFAGVDAIVLTSERWLSAVTPLVELRSKQGQNLRAISWERLQLLSDGSERPEEFLHGFLESIYLRHRQLRGLLLFGDSSYDRRLGSDPRNILPTWLESPTSREIVSLQIAGDQRFGELCLDAAGAEISVGRLPVATRAEALTVVDKLLRQPSLHLAEDQGRWLVVSDRAVEFEIDSAFFMNSVSGFATGSSALEFRALSSMSGRQLERRLTQDWAQGLDLVAYFGHGSRTTWSAESIVGADRIDALSGQRLPMVVAINCLNTFFHHPSGPGLGEAMVLHPWGGALAYWGPSGVGSRLEQRQWARWFVQQAVRPHVTLGELIRGVHRSAIEADVTVEERQRWLLIGDPTLPLRRL